MPARQVAEIQGSTKQLTGRDPSGQVPLAPADAAGVIRTGPSPLDAGAGLPFVALLPAEPGDSLLGLADGEGLAPGVLLPLLPPASGAVLLASEAGVGLTCGALLPLLPPASGAVLLASEGGDGLACAAWLPLLPAESGAALPAPAVGVGLASGVLLPLLPVLPLLPLLPIECWAALLAPKAGEGLACGVLLPLLPLLSVALPSCAGVVGVGLTSVTLLLLAAGATCHVGGLRLLPDDNAGVEGEGLLVLSPSK